MDDWSNEGYARSRDATAHEGNPTRAEQIDVLLSVLVDEYRPGTTILDFGSGSGLLEEAIFRRIPEAVVIGVDGSPAMLSIAHERLRGHSSQFSGVHHDLTRISVR